jgi:signal transduction histidine kinase
MRLIGPIPPIAAAILRVPLATKLVGANLVLLAACALIALAAGWRPTGLAQVVALTLACIASLALTVFLVVVALRPIRAVEETALLVSDGDYEARVPFSPLADRSMTRVGTTFNTLLDRLTSDRRHMRELAAQVIRAGDRERANASLALHDSAAQSIAAIAWQLAALSRDTENPEWNHSLLRIKRIADDVLEEIRLLAESLHPRVLDDLGLAAALAHLARQAGINSGVPVRVEVDAPASARLSSTVATAFYRVAQEALANALYHGDPKGVTIRLLLLDEVSIIVIADDGHGFDVAGAEQLRPGSGIFAMRERAALVDAHFSIRSTVNGGTSVRAHIYHTPAAQERTA